MAIAGRGQDTFGITTMPVGFIGSISVEDTATECKGRIYARSQSDGMFAPVPKAASSELSINIRSATMNESDKSISLDILKEIAACK